MKRLILSVWLICLVVFNISAQDQTINGNLDVKGKVFLHTVNQLANTWGQSYLQYNGHNLIIGSPTNRWSHNVIQLKPGGTTMGEIFSALEIYRAIGPDNQVCFIKLSTQKGVSNYINNGGNFGIGTETPQSMLDVRGKIIADEVEVKVNKAPDFVFESDYNLRPLSEVEAFVKENKHLPEIPSEKQMIENGVNVNDMQMKLLQKIEELTLYVIEQGKEIKKLKERLGE